MTSFVIPIPNEEFQLFFMTIVFFGCFILAGSFAVWKVYRRTGELDYIDDHINKFDRHLKMAMKSVIVYLCMLPIFCLVILGGVYLVDKNPNWYIPIVLINMFFSLLSLVFIVILPLLRVLYSMCFVGAIVINKYVEMEEPLRYHESKVCEGRRREEPSKYDYMLAEPKKQNSEPNLL